MIKAKLTARLYMLMTPAEKETLAGMADREDTSMGEVVRRLIAQAASTEASA